VHDRGSLFKPILLHHSRAVPQSNFRLRPALAGREVGRDRTAEQRDELPLAEPSRQVPQRDKLSTSHRVGHVARVSGIAALDRLSRV
jgi:hypothetical protein